MHRYPSRPAACLLTLLLFATPAFAQQPAPAAPPPGAYDLPDAKNRSTQAFQVILLQADMHGTGTSEGLPSSAQKALNDLKDFLPFRSYTTLDFAWLRTFGTATATLTGPNGRALQARINARLGPTGARGERILISNFELRDAALDPMRAPVAPRPGEGQAYAEGRTPAPPSNLISTQFGMDVGETVVVGTSKLNGADKALVVLLTAVPPNGGRQP